MIYCGRPTLRGNPFHWKRFGIAQAVRLYRDWVDGKLSIGRLARLGFSEAEIGALTRWRARLVAELPRLRDRDLQCWCPLNARFCHVDVLLERANA